MCFGSFPAPECCRSNAALATSTRFPLSLHEAACAHGEEDAGSASPLSNVPQQLRSTEALTQLIILMSPGTNSTKAAGSGVMNPARYASACAAVRDHDRFWGCPISRRWTDRDLHGAALVSGPDRVNGGAHAAFISCEIQQHQILNSSLRSAACLVEQNLHQPGENKAKTNIRPPR